MKRAIFPGTFDPFTNGHLEILQQALGIFGHVTVAVAQGGRKKTLFDLEERCQLIKESVNENPEVTVVGFDGLLVDFADSIEADVLVRGLRKVGDLEYELEMAFANRRLNDAIQTIFLATSESTAMISSSLVREINHWKGDVTSFVPPVVAAALESKRTS